MWDGHRKRFGFTGGHQGWEGGSDAALGSYSWPSACPWEGSTQFFLPCLWKAFAAGSFLTCLLPAAFWVASTPLTACSVPLSLSKSGFCPGHRGCPLPDGCFLGEDPVLWLNILTFRSFLGFSRRWCGLCVHSSAAVSGFQHLLLSGEAEKSCGLTDLTPLCLPPFTISSTKPGGAFKTLLTCPRLGSVLVTLERHRHSASVQQGSLSSTPRNASHLLPSPRFH